MLVSKLEVRDLAISTAVLAFALGGLAGFLPALLVVAIVFLAHEISHKAIAQRYGCAAEYRMWPIGLMLALISSFFGFVFAAPGAVYISPVTVRRFAFRVVHLTVKEYGHIALGGPLVNIIMGVVFALLFEFLSIGLFGLIARFSFFLGLFNLLPIPPLDGSKVFAWNKSAWAGALVLAIAGYVGMLLL